MAFLFKSKKSQEKAAAATAATRAEQAHAVAANVVSGSQTPIPGANGRGSKEHKDGGTLSPVPTPTSSVNNSINSFHGNVPTSPDPPHAAGRRGPSVEPASDLPVSLPRCDIKSD